MTDQNSLLNKQRAGSFGIMTFFPKPSLQVLVEEAGSATCLNKVHAWERNPGARMKHHSLPRAPVGGQRGEEREPPRPPKMLWLASTRSFIGILMLAHQLLRQGALNILRPRPHSQRS